MKTLLRIIAVAALAFGVNSRLFAASIGVNWMNNNSGGVQNNSADSLNPTDLAGVPAYAQTNWNNLGRWGNPTPLNDSISNSVGVDITWDANWTLNTGIGTSTPDQKLMFGAPQATGEADNDGPPYNGYSGPNQPDARVRGLGAWLAAHDASTYSVIVYVDGNLTDGSVSEHWIQAIDTDGDFGGGITLGTDLTPHIFVSDTANFSGTFTQVSPGATSQGAAGAGNYILFTGLSADMFMLRSEDTYATYAPVSGLQIVPEYTKPHLDVPPKAPASALYTGQSFSLTVVAAGPKMITYQWRKDSSPLTNQTNSVYSVAGITTDNSGSYDVIVSNSFGSVTSAPVVISVNGESAPLNAVVSPASVSRGVGGAIAFSVTADGTTPFTYQWRQGATALSGETNATLKLTNLTLAQMGSYTCAISNIVGGTISSAGVLSVHAVAGTTLGVNFEDASGADVTDTAFGVPLADWLNATPGPTGSASVGSLSISWSSKNTWRQGFAGTPEDQVFYGYLDDGTDVNNPAGPSVTITGLETVFGAYVVRVASATDNGISLLDVMITNGPAIVSFPSPQSNGGAKYGLSTVSPSLTDPTLKLQGHNGENGGPRGGIAGFIITDKPVIDAQPRTSAVPLYVGSTLTFTGASAFGVPPLSYQWRKDGMTIPGATSLNYTNASPTTGDSGSYSLVVTNAFGSATSAVVAVTISSSAPFNAAVDPASATFSVGGTITFSASAEGNLPMTFQWHKGATKLDGETSATLTLSNLQTTDSGDYSCAITNSIGGTIGTTASLTVNAVPPATLGIDFSAVGETVTATALGVDPTNWVSVPGPVNSGTMFGPVLITCTSGGTWQQGDFIPAGNNEVFYGYLDDNGSAPSATISGLASVFPVYVVQTLAATDAGSSLQNVTINGTETLSYPSPVDNGSGGLTGISTQTGALYGDTVTVQGMSGLSGQARGGLAGIIITDKPVLETEPQAPANTIYTDGSFSITGLTVIGVPPLAYQWRKGGVEIPGANGSDYFKSGVTMGDGGDYDVIVTNAFGAVTSSIVTISGIATMPTVTVTRSGNDLVLDWPSGSLLLEATNIAGPWTTNSAPPPLPVTPTEPQKFYRLQLP